MKYSYKYNFILLLYCLISCDSNTHKSNISTYSYKFNNINLLSENLDSINIKNIINKNSILVYKTSDLHCEVCIFNHIDVINSIVRTNSELGNIVIFVKSNNHDYVKYFRNKYQVDKSIKIYLIKNIRLPLDDLNEPIFYIVNNQLYLENIYYPTSDVSSLEKQLQEMVLALTTRS